MGQALLENGIIHHGERKLNPLSVSVSLFHFLFLYTFLQLPYNFLHSFEKSLFSHLTLHLLAFLLILFSSDLLSPPFFV